MYFSPEPWSKQDQIIIGIDIGATQSAVSYAYLYPSGTQSSTRVIDWPGQERQKGEAKIPTQVYYNTNRRAVSFGAETLTRETIGRAEDEGWSLVRHFKLHLHPPAMTRRHHSRPDPLPQGVSLLQVYKDFMGYLMQHTRWFFELHVTNGHKVWEAHSQNKIVVITHPNGWTSQEQEVLREAAVQAGYVPRAKSDIQIRFVTEGEASVHFCITHSNLRNELKPKNDLLVCDAGGSTVDITVYRVKATTPILEIEERKAPACEQAGGLYVDKGFHEYIRQLFAQLELSNEDREDLLQCCLKDFETSAKRIFKSQAKDGAIDTNTKMTNRSIGLFRGLLKVPGEKMRSFFDYCVNTTVSTVRDQIKGLDCRHILLVGGFGDSPYLRSEISTGFSRGNCSVTISNDSTAKAVADGAVIWFAVTFVSSRATRMKYGVLCDILYNPQNSQHRLRERITKPDGREYVVNAWSQIIDKDVIMKPREPFRQTYWRQWSFMPDFIEITDKVYAWTYNGEPLSEWLLDSNGKL